MPRYMVELNKTTRSTAEVEIEAESEKLAKEEAYALWLQDFDDKRVEWDVLEEDCVIGDCENVNLED